VSQTPPQVDHFSSVAELYATRRPTYPAALFQAVADHSPALEHVWDCACGNGQASRDLARHFSRVTATDLSAEQIATAVPHPRIDYRVAPAHQSGLPDQCLDAVMVAAAIHWFAGPDFNRELQRVCRPGALLTWIGYRPIQVPAGLQPTVDRFYLEVLAPWWPPQRRHVDADYQDLPFPGVEMPFPTVWVIERHWSLDNLLEYFTTWSAVQVARRSGVDPLPALAEEVRQHWPGNPSDAVLVTWQVMGRWGYLP
jgi:SAM-dependent methyltransferase